MAVHRLADDRERLGQHVAGADFSAADAFTHLGGAGAELIVRLFCDVRFLLVDLVDDLAVALEQTFIAAAKNLGQHLSNGGLHDNLF